MKFFLGNRALFKPKISAGKSSKLTTTNLSEKEDDEEEVDDDESNDETLKDSNSQEQQQSSSEQQQTEKIRKKRRKKRLRLTENLPKPPAKKGRIGEKKEKLVIEKKEVNFSLPILKVYSSFLNSAF